MNFVIVELKTRRSGGAAELSQAIWEQETQAKERGLHAVIELYSPKSKLCAEIAKIWKRNDQLTRETLDGICLIRINVTQAGPKRILSLTPKAILGVPLFLAWNKIGQTIARSQFAEFPRSKLELPLSAYFEDVAASRPFRFEPKGNRPRPKVVSPEHDAGMPPPASPDAKPRPPNGAPNPHVAALNQQLGTYLVTALALAQGRLTEKGLLSDLSLESLVELDVLLAEDPTLRSGGADAQQFIASLAVYFGETIRNYSEASWFVDLSAASLSAALRLKVKTLSERQDDLAPMGALISALEDASPGLFARCVELCGLLPNTGSPGERLG